MENNNSISMPIDINDINGFGKPIHLNPMSISWHNIQVFSENNNKLFKLHLKPKEILKNVSGEVNSGQLLAIMGSSGAGKTTLLNVLTARSSPKLKVKGEVKINGETVNSSVIKSVSSYVKQNDLFLPLLTVREHLMFQSLLRMDQRLCKTERNQRINDLIQKFNLMKCSETRIANISGGESKRLSFATEVMTDPSIMFCDEPTSGLDSYMAKNIITSLKGMAAEGRSVICTIHQPSSQVFELFEHLLLLADGRVAYMGEKVKANTFFSSIGYECPKDYNPSDYYIEELALIPGRECESNDKLNKICDCFAEYSNALKTFYFNENIRQTNDSFDKEFVNTFSTGYRTDSYHQLWTLLKRSFLSVIREPKITKVRIFTTIIIAIIMGTLYGNGSGQEKIQNINSSLFTMITVVGYSIAFTVIGTFCTEIPLVLNENNSRLYSPGTYFLSKVFIEFPVFLLVPIIYVSITYYMIGLTNDLYTFVMTIFIGILLTNCAVAYGYLISCASGSTVLAASLTQPFTMVLVLFSGFFLNNSTLPPWLSWIKFLSWFYYGYEALVLNQWIDVKHIDCIQIGINSTEIQDSCYKNGLDVIKKLYLGENNLYRDLLCLTAIPITFLFLSFIALSIRVNRNVLNDN